MPTDGKTNNSFLKNKIELRLKDLPEEPSVLDCFGGAGLIWKAVEQRLGRPIRYIGIDVEDYETGFYLPGDNMDYLPIMDLSRFNVIDLDAYGVPYDQLKVLFDRGYHGRVYVTFVQLIVGVLPFEFLQEVGFSKEMIEACPTICYRRGWQHFLQWLARNGVREIRHRSHNKKHYLAFDL